MCGTHLDKVKIAYFIYKNFNTQELKNCCYFNLGRNMTKALFYVHGFIRHGLSWKEKKKHYIMPEYCRFGKLSSIVFCKVSNPNIQDIGFWVNIVLHFLASTGKIAILDSNNHFHLGVDTKRGGLWPLVPMAIDFSLILEKHKYSLVPHFDQNHHPSKILSKIF